MHEIDGNSTYFPVILVGYKDAIMTVQEFRFTEREVLGDRIGNIHCRNIVGQIPSSLVDNCPVVSQVKLIPWHVIATPGAQGGLPQASPNPQKHRLQMEPMCTLILFQGNDTGPSASMLRCKRGVVPQLGDDAA